MKRVMMVSSVLAAAFGLWAGSASGLSYTTLSVPGAYDTWATGICGNNIVGYYSDLSGFRHGFIYDGTTYTTVVQGPSGETYFEGISGNTIVGHTGVEEGEGFLYNGGSFQYVGVPGSVYTSVLGISGNTIVGDYAGAEGSPDPYQHGYRWDGPYYGGIQPTTLLNVPWYGATLPYGVDGNNIVGWNAYHGAHGFLYNGSTYTMLDVPGATKTYAYGISGNTIVGYYSNSGSAWEGHGFLYDGTNYTTIDLPGWSGETFVRGIYGDKVVGWYGYRFYQGFVATIPGLPEPSSFVLLVVAGTALLGYRFRRNGRVR